MSWLIDLLREYLVPRKPPKELDEMVFKMTRRKTNWIDVPVVIEDMTTESDGPVYYLNHSELGSDYSFNTRDSRLRRRSLVYEDERIRSEYIDILPHNAEYHAVMDILKKVKWHD